MLQEGNSEGNSMDWESVVATEHHENLSLDGLEHRKGHAVARRGGGFRVIGSVVQPFSSILLAMSLVAQQLTTVSAQSMCNVFSSYGIFSKHLDLIGLISAFKTEAATKSLTYSALNDGLLYLTGHVGPGSLSVAAALFEATGFDVARLFALGGTGDAFQLVQMDCPDGLHYIGLKSGTECPVVNAVGASIVREHASLWKTTITESTDEVKDLEMGGVPRNGERVGREAGREVKVIVLEVGRADEENTAKQEVRVSLRASRKRNGLWLGWLPFLLTIGVIVSCFMCKQKQKFVGILLSGGTLGMMLAVLGLRHCIAFKSNMPKVAPGAPPGDCLVIDEKDANILHIFQGAEGPIQALFQRKIDYEASVGKYVLVLAGIILYVYTITSILALPSVSSTGQIQFVVANMIGLVADMAKASEKGKLGLAKKAREQFKINLKHLLVFKNRTAAVAFVATHANDCTMLKSKKLLPSDGPVWQEWWANLAQKCGKPRVTKVDAVKNEELLESLQASMNDGIARAIF